MFLTFHNFYIPTFCKMMNYVKEMSKIMDTEEIKFQRKFQINLDQIWRTSGPERKVDGTLLQSVFRNSDSKGGRGRHNAEFVTWGLDKLRRATSCCLRSHFPTNSTPSILAIPVY